MSTLIHSCSCAGDLGCLAMCLLGGLTITAGYGIETWLCADDQLRCYLLIFTAETTCLSACLLFSQILFGLAVFGAASTA